MFNHIVPNRITKPNPILSNKDFQPAPKTSKEPDKESDGEYDPEKDSEWHQEKVSSISSDTRVLHQSTHPWKKQFSMGDQVAEEFYLQSGSKS